MKEESTVRNQLRALRGRIGKSQQELARAAGVTRQTIGGIESGQYAPSAAVALKLARALGCRVEELFWLDDEPAEIAAEGVIEAGTDPVRVTLARVGSRWVAHPLTGAQAFRTEMVPADGFATACAEDRSVRVRLLDELETLERTVLLAGCAPSLSLWARSAERWYPGLRVHWIHANSSEALKMLARGEVHAAGVHLCDQETGESNTPFVRRAGLGEAALVTLGDWEEGLVLAPGNPKGIGSIADIAREGVRLINREEGSGARLQLDRALQEAAIRPEQVAGYETIAQSHLDVAQAVLSGTADVGMTVASVAAAFRLPFLCLRSVAYELAMRRETLEYTPVEQLLSTLHHRWVRSQLEALGGYDTTTSGAVRLV